MSPALLALALNDITGRLQPWPPLVALLAPLVLGLLVMPLAIGILATLGLGQRVREEGPKGHLAKEGTPTAGGIVVIVLILLTVFLVDRRGDVMVALAALLLAAALGFVDDILSVRPGRTRRGIPARQRIVIQVIIGLGLGFWFLALHQDQQVVPLIGTWKMGWLIVPLAAFALVASANAFNLTDGSDGLAPGVMVVVVLALALMSRNLHQVALIRLLLATAGALLAFLAYNLPPARVFMGGVGAEGIGMMIAAIAVSAGLIWYLPLVAVVPMLEVLSVIVQVVGFRRFGRRIFRMTPIHHHFHLAGWSEWTVAITAWLVSGAAGAIGLFVVRRPA